MGAVLATDEIADAMAPGDHGTTFGGGALVSTVAIAVLETIGRSEFLAEVTRKGAYLRTLLEGLSARWPEKVREVRGRGLILGIELVEPAAPLVAGARERGLLTVPAGSHVIRFLPPLTVSDAEIERAVEIFAECLG
jgi:acetylornithine/succinyldiaminopimelate/putrescine aminotransferase